VALSFYKLPHVVSIVTEDEIKNKTTAASREDSDEFLPVI
jgi:hypothetical protein